MKTFGEPRLAIPALTGLLQIGLLCVICYVLAAGLYRSFLHPLSKFPGPRLAALTFCYEYYYEVFPHTGRYMWKIKQLHEKYGTSPES